MNYLIKSRHGIYYFRLCVPEACRASLGKTEVRRSLRTRSKREALVGAAKLLLEAQELLGGLGKEIGQGTISVVTPIQKSAPILSEVLKERAKDQKLRGVSPKTIADNTYQGELLVHIIGDKPINQYTKGDAKKFKEKALKLPPKATQLLSKKAVSEVIKGAKTTVSINTYNHYVRNLSSVFEFAIVQEYTESNPFKNLVITQRVKASSHRDVFTPEQIKTLFEASKGCRKVYQRWLPYLGYYTGARMNELCQLYKDDVKVINGIHCIHIQAVRPDQRLKSLSSERVIPIHSKLIDLGFIDYISSLESTERVFPELTYRESSGYSANVSKWFQDFRERLGITGKVSFHSFRHTVADSLKQQGYSENLIGAILGHFVGGITSNRYGKQFKPLILLPVINAIETIDT